MNLWSKGTDKSVKLFARFISTNSYSFGLSEISINFLRCFNKNYTTKFLSFRRHLNLKAPSRTRATEFGPKSSSQRISFIRLPSASASYIVQLFQRIPRPRFRSLVPFPLTIALTVLTPVKCEGEDVYCTCTSCTKRVRSESETPGPGNTDPNPSNKTCESKVNSSPSSREITTSNSNYNPPVTDWLEPKDLSNGALIKQACVLTVDSITRILSQVVLAIEDYHGQYRTFLDLMIEMLQECRSCTPVQQELLECKLVVLRSRMEDMKKNVTTLEAYLNSVEKLALAAAETAFLGNAEYQSVAMVERLDSALAQIKRIKDESKGLERDMLELQSLLIVESGKSLK